MLAKYGSRRYASVVAFPLLVACGGAFTAESGKGDGGAASGGASQGGAAGKGAGGSPATGGASIGGTSATGGSGGTQATGGSGATAGSGSGGGAMATAECAVNEDCAIFDDCCSCSAGPVANPPAQCELACEQSSCSARGLEGPKARCVGKRCVFDVSCNRTRVNCRSAAPICDAGQVPSVIGTCWGPCVAATECAEVTDCADCSAGTVCVRNGDFAGFTHCVHVSSQCAAKPTCECTNACRFACTAESGISCFCPQC